jgi:hypothetical protein
MFAYGPVRVSVPQEQLFFGWLECWLLVSASRELTGLVVIHNSDISVSGTQLIFRHVQVRLESTHN